MIKHLYFAFQMSSTTPAGTIAYLMDEEALLVRVSSGWQYIAVRLYLYIIILYKNSKIY